MLHLSSASVFKHYDFLGRISQIGGFFGKRIQSEHILLDRKFLTEISENLIANAKLAI